MRNTPWYHQRRSESAPPAERNKEPPTITQQQQEEMVNRISRPTESARYRQSLFWKLDGYMDKGFHSWSKMELFDDCKQCMWTPNGTIKGSCKIRPVNVLLPPLLRSREVTASADNGTARSAVGSSNSGSVATSRLESRCESRRAVLRPRPSMERSRTSFVARPIRSSVSSTSTSSHHNPQNAARSFLIRNLSNGRLPSNIGNMAVPRMNNANSTTVSAN